MAPTFDPVEIDAAIRDITDDEVAHYHEYGWVKLDGLISPDLAAELLRVAQAIQEESKTLPETVQTTEWGEDKRRETENWQVRWSDWWFEARHIMLEPFRSFTFSKKLALNSAKLMNRRRLADSDVGVRYLEDALLCKFPAGQQSGGPTGYHQDGYGMDRIGGFTYWVALDEVKPEQGALRYLTGSHREGPLGRGPKGVLEAYPKLVENYEWSPPLHYKPGDASAHFENLVHGADENLTDRPRWSYVPTYIPSDAKPAAQHGDVVFDERFPVISV